jgi:hypothetical protein
MQHAVRAVSIVTGWKTAEMQAPVVAEFSRVWPCTLDHSVLRMCKEAVGTSQRTCSTRLQASAHR